MTDKKEIDKDRFYWNPKTQEKIFSHYMDGSAIKLDAEKAKKAEECKKACTARALKQIEKDPRMRDKPKEKRGIKEPKVEEPKEEKPKK